jgi:hypothetical protein
MGATDSAVDTLLRGDAPTRAPVGVLLTPESRAKEA